MVFDQMSGDESRWEVDDEALTGRRARLRAVGRGRDDRRWGRSASSRRGESWVLFIGRVQNQLRGQR